MSGENNPTDLGNLVRLDESLIAQFAESCSFRKLFHRRTGAEEIAIAVNVVDPGDGRPEFVFARPRRGIGGLLARIGPVPFVGDRLAARCAAHFSERYFADRPFRSRSLRSRHGWKSSRRKSDRARLSIRSRSARSSSFRRPETKPSAREIRNPSGAWPRLPLRRPRSSIDANRECIHARRGRVCPLKRTGKIRIEPLRDVVRVQDRDLGRFG